MKTVLERRLKYSREEITAHVRQAVEDIPIQQVILFGSYARGTATTLSDIDLLPSGTRISGFCSVVSVTFDRTLTIT